MLGKILKRDEISILFGVFKSVPNTLLFGSDFQSRFQMRSYLVIYLIAVPNTFLFVTGFY